MNSITPDLIIETARGCLGTPYQHTGRVAGKDGGLDCVGLLIHIARVLGAPVDVTDVYGSWGLLDSMNEGFQAYCDKVPISERAKGDFLIFSARMMPHHAGVFTGSGVGERNTLIHMWRNHGGCVEMPMNDYWVDSIYSVYRLKTEFGYIN